MTTLLLHGFSGSAQSFSTLIPKLDDEAIALDLPGHASSFDVASNWQENIDELLKRIRALNRTCLHLVGYSFGARLALGLLESDPSLFDRVSLIGVNPGLRTVEERRVRKATDQTWVRLLREEGIDVFINKWQALDLFASQKKLPQILLDRQNAIRRAHDPCELADALEVLGLAEMPDYWPLLERNAISLRLIVGEDDLKFINIARACVNKNSALKLKIVSNCGHNVMLEKSDELADMLNNFS